jgi:hypothetical protein
MNTSFVLLNQGWNAEPNAPEPRIAFHGSDVVLSFVVNAFQFPQFADGSICSIKFNKAWRYRLGATNDEGWHLGQCRFSKLAPAWGEFYEVSGNLLLESAPQDWVITAAPQPESHHYLFYLRDQTFECDAASYQVQLPLQRVSS